jgi:hypothetical protein
LYSKKEKDKYEDSLEKERLWESAPKNLCKKIADLLEFAGKVIESNSADEEKMILWSNVN